MSPSYINCVAGTETDIPRRDTRNGLIGHIFIGERKSGSFLFPFLTISDTLGRCNRRSGVFLVYMH